jgi:ribosomal protein L37AE/L43A
VSGRKVWQAEFLAKNPHLLPVEQREEATMSSKDNRPKCPSCPRRWLNWIDDQWICPGCGAEWADETVRPESASCSGVVGTPHSFRDFRSPRTGQDYQACIVCGVRADNGSYVRSNDRKPGQT